MVYIFWVPMGTFERGVNNNFISKVEVASYLMLAWTSALRIIGLQIRR
jgi:hypothetical protein